MFAVIPPSWPAAVAVLVFCFVLVLAFESSNGFHDTANAVATVIYTHSLKPMPATRGLGQGVDWSQVWAGLRALFVPPRRRDSRNGTATGEARPVMVRRPRANRTMRPAASRMMCQRSSSGQAPDVIRQANQLT
jgi:hypothetical protein